jgi:hypothetical protein
VNDLPQIIVWFVDLKEWLVGSFGQSNDAMHVHVGLTLYLSLLLVLPRLTGGRGGAWLAFALLAVLSLVAEVFDITALVTINVPFDPMESVRDVGNTLGWPLVLTVLLRWQMRPR